MLVNASLIYEVLDCGDLVKTPFILFPDICVFPWLFMCCHIQLTRGSNAAGVGARCASTDFWRLLSEQSLEGITLGCVFFFFLI